jgi:hypothetical protein
VGAAAEGAPRKRLLLARQLYDDPVPAALCSVQTRSLGCELWRVVGLCVAYVLVHVPGSRAWGIGTVQSVKAGREEVNFGTSGLKKIIQ